MPHTPRQQWGGDAEAGEMTSPGSALRRHGRRGFGSEAYTAESWAVEYFPQPSSHFSTSGLEIAAHPSQNIPQTLQVVSSGNTDYSGNLSRQGWSESSSEEPETGLKTPWISCPHCYTDCVTKVHVGGDWHILCEYCNCITRMVKDLATGDFRADTFWGGYSSDESEDETPPLLVICLQ